MFSRVPAVRWTVVEPASDGLPSKPTNRSTLLPGSPVASRTCRLVFVAPPLQLPASVSR